MKFLAEAVAFHEHCEDKEYPGEDPSDEVFSEEHLSDYGQQQQQLPGVLTTPQKSQVPSMPPPPRKEAVKQETEEETVSSVKGVRNLSL